jgi:hypothetical protein
MYLGETFSTLHLKNIDDWAKHFDSWPENAPLCVHAEGNCVPAVILLGKLSILLEILCFALIWVN